MISKVEDHHRQRPAYIYVRQSTMGQVRHHQESTERQYALKGKAVELGWDEANIRVLDRDLGIPEPAKGFGRLFPRRLNRLLQSIALCPHLAQL